jgi:hypothetical protein
METKTAYDLLLNAPDEQVKRCQLAWKAIAKGEWVDAAHYLRNAANEEGNTEWAQEARAMSDACMKQVNPYRLVAGNSGASKYWGADRG